MQNQEKFNKILTESYKRMHLYTCAEASLQGLLKLWEIDQKILTWATAGYMGAIQSGKTTCGLLIGSSCAMGFRLGQNLNSIPEDTSKIRNKNIRMVKRFYKAFIKEFGSTECKELCKIDFSNPEDAANYLISQGWKSTCDIFLNWVMKYFNELTENNKI